MHAFTDDRSWIRIIFVVATICKVR